MQFYNFFALSAEVVTDASMLRFPDVNNKSIVFVYAGDIWTVAKEGGIARRLSSPKGQELFPKFSPDGKSIAFSGNYDGNIDIFVMPSQGGEVHRLTHHPDGDYVVDWYPDSKSILYKSQMHSFVRRFNKLFKQRVSGGMPEELPLPYGEFASFGSSDDELAFQIISRESRYWKRYRGGMASDIWLYDFNSDTVSKLTHFEGSDSLPMWDGNNIYFLSDRGKNKRHNIWRLNLKNKEVNQLTFFDEYDVKWPSIGGDSIVFENGGKLFLLNTKSETIKELDIIVPSDLPQVRPKLVNLKKYINNYKISPKGSRTLFEARGEIFILDNKKDIIKNISNSSGSAERHPVWSSDGKSVAYLTDQSGEYELEILNLTDNSEIQIKLDKGFYYNLKWSPNNKKIALSDNTGGIYIVDINSNIVNRIDKDEWSRIKHYSWSPDSNWLSYSKKLDNYQSSIFIYNTQNDQINQITGDFYNDYSPVFGSGGKYLSFYSNRHFKPVYDDMDDTWIYPNSTQLFLITLKKGTKSPFFPDIEYEISDDEKDKNKDRKRNRNNRKTEQQIEIDFEGIENRIIKIPIAPGNFKGLEFVDDKIFYLRGPKIRANEKNSQFVLQYYDIKKKKENTLLKGINDFDISYDGKKFLYKSKDKFGILATDKEGKIGKGKIKSDKIKAFIDYKQEWKQIFYEAWRIERDFFYDPNMHGVDWVDIRDRYSKLLDHVVSREDLNYVIGEMIAELNSSHTYVGKGDIDNPKKVNVGLLGCDFSYDVENNAYYINKIYKEKSSDAGIVSPLLTPGLDIKEGDYLLAVNGVKIDTSKDPWASFQGLANQVVELTINSLPTQDGAKRVLIKTIDRKKDLKLRYYDWVETNRKYVNEKTNGRVGYIYVPDTSSRGQNELVRQFVPQVVKEGLIIDERFNGGGQIPDRFIELLNRPLYNYWARRGVNFIKSPFLSHTGAKVMIINGWAGSGGDAFPFYFKKAGIGELVGKRTLGALIGIGGYPKLIDGGYVSAPSYAYFDADGKWGIEGYGVDPDYEIENISFKNPSENDPQLDKAIEVILDKINQKKTDKPELPQYPDRSRN